MMDDRGFRWALLVVVVAFAIFIAAKYSKFDQRLDDLMDEFERVKS